MHFIWKIFVVVTLALATFAFVWAISKQYKFSKCAEGAPYIPKPIKAAA